MLREASSWCRHVLAPVLLIGVVKEAYLRRAAAMLALTLYLLKLCRILEENEYILWNKRHTHIHLFRSLFSSHHLKLFWEKKCRLLLIRYWSLTSETYNTFIKDRKFSVFLELFWYKSDAMKCLFISGSKFSYVLVQILFFSSDEKIEIQGLGGVSDMFDGTCRKKQNRKKNPKLDKFWSHAYYLIPLYHLWF